MVTKRFFHFLLAYWLVLVAMRRCPADINPISTSDQISVGTPTLLPHPPSPFRARDYSRSS